MASNKKQILVPDISRRKPAKNRKDYVVHKKKNRLQNMLPYQIPYTVWSYGAPSQSFCFILVQILIQGFLFFSCQRSHYPGISERTINF